MNQIRVEGMLRRDEREGKCTSGHIFWLDVTRKSGTVDTLLVVSKDPDITEGMVYVAGSVKADYIHGLGVPAYIVPDSVEHLHSEQSDFSEAVVTGVLKAVPKLRETHGGKDNAKGGKTIASMLIMTDDGPVPIIAWGHIAKNAADNFKAGDTIQATGRLQSRQYVTRKGEKRITFELSAYTVAEA